MAELTMYVGTELAEEVWRCAAAAGYTVVPADPVDDSGYWPGADVVVVDAAAVNVLIESTVARRHAVLLVCPADAPPRVWQDAVAIGVTDGFELPADEERLVAALTDLRAPKQSGGRVLAVLGGHGGAGATTLAAATGLAAAQLDSRRRVLLIGPDETGAGIDLMLGIEDVDGPRTADLSAVGGRLSHDALHEALPHVDRRLSVLAAEPRTGRSGGHAESVVAAVDAGRAGGDVVVVDVPRTQPALRRELLHRADLIVLLSRALLPAIAATRAAHRDIGESRGQAELVLRGPAPSGVPVDEMAWAAGLPLLGYYRSDPSLPSRMESGALRPSPRSPLGVVAGRLCRRLDEAAS